MRLLLLLSALLGALTGLSGTRAVAQPVQASASIGVAAAGIAAVVAVPVRFAVPAWGTTPPRLIGPARPVSAATARLLYAERRRQ